MNLKNLNETYIYIIVFKINYLILLKSRIFNNK